MGSMANVVSYTSQVNYIQVLIISYKTKNQLAQDKIDSTKLTHPLNSKAVPRLFNIESSIAQQQKSQLFILIHKVTIKPKLKEAPSDFKTISLTIQPVPLKSISCRGKRNKSIKTNEPRMSIIT